MDHQEGGERGILFYAKFVPTRELYTISILDLFIFLNKHTNISINVASIA